MNAKELLHETDYIKYRGTCKEACEELIAKDPSLTLVRGHYFCPLWYSDEEHWWCVNEYKELIDQTNKQFPSKGHGFFTGFDGYFTCEICGKKVKEEEVIMNGNHPTCSDKCTFELFM
jgi:hypothetical protein